MTPPTAATGGRRFLGSRPFWFGLAMMLLAIPMSLVLLRGPGPRGPVELAPAELPVLGIVPPLALVDQDGKAFDLTRVQGRPVVANFIFTTCPTVCPLLTQKLSRIERRTKDLGERVHFLSLTVDPETDTPPVLKAFGDAHKVDWSRWTFVTGPVEPLGKVIEEGFRIGVTKEPKAGAAGNPDMYEIVHGEHFVLVDGAGRIRGYYGNNDADHDRLVTDLARLAGGDAT